MQGTFISTMAFLLLVACGCSRPETQKTLAGRLAQADRVIVLSHDGETMMVQGEQLKKIVQALAASEKVSISRNEAVTAAPSNTLVFFKNLVHLATVPTGADNVFYIDTMPYEDRSKTLLEIAKMFSEKHPDR
jgi:hypothetical protein